MNINLFRRLASLRHVLPAFILGISLLLALMPTAHAGQCTASNADEYAFAIGYGHAFAKHQAEFVQGVDKAGLKFPGPTITDESEFESFIVDILNNPSDSKNLLNYRHAYWDATTGTIVITDGKTSDCGTAFRPDDGKLYYDKQK